MEPVRRWATRIAAVVTTATLAVLVPAMAWASTSPAYQLAGEMARSRRRMGFGGIFSLLCCLVVVAIVVVVLLIVMRSRKRR